MDPDISVVIPTYNRKEYLQQAISSCFEGNEGVEVEVVVVDDGSTDGTREYLQQLDVNRVHPVFQEHKGGQYARNCGLSEARGKYVKFLDDDDWLAPDALEKEVSLLERSGADMSSSGCVFVDRHGNPIEETSFPRIDDLAIACFQGSVGPQPLRHTYRTDFLEGMQWNESLPCRQDFAFIMEVALQDPEHVCSDIIVGYKRQHAGGLSERSPERGTRMHYRILCEAAKALIERGEENDELLQAAAQGLWEWGRVRATRDWSEFEGALALISQLDPGFSPRRESVVLHALDRMGRPVLTEKMTLPLRRLRHSHQ